MQAPLLTEPGDLGAISQAEATKAGVPDMYIRSFQGDTGSLLSLLKWIGGRRGELMYTGLPSLWGASRQPLDIC